MKALLVLTLMIMGISVLVVMTSDIETNSETKSGEYSETKSGEYSETSIFDCSETAQQERMNILTLAALAGIIYDIKKISDAHVTLPTGPAFEETKWDHKHTIIDNVGQVVVCGTGKSWVLVDVRDGRTNKKLGSWTPVYGYR